jgi:hypothetical protein
VDSGFPRFDDGGVGPDDALSQHHLHPVHPRPSSVVICQPIQRDKQSTRDDECPLYDEWTDGWIKLMNEDSINE